MANERQWIGDWNTIWDFAPGGSTAAGPSKRRFRSSRCATGPATTQVWGFNAMRTNRWKNELSFLTPTPQAQGQSGHPHGLARGARSSASTAPPGSKNLEIKPYAISNATAQRGTARPAIATT